MVTTAYLRAFAAMALASGAVAQCETSTETNLAVATTLSDYSQFRASMDQIYSTAEDAFTGATVYVWTTLEDSPEGSFTAYGVYDANALTSAGYTITTETAYITTCNTAEPTEETGSLSPSPTGAECSPHGDHWHCDEPTGTSMEISGGSLAASATCEPHQDHWHCPDGVPEPTTPPSGTATASGEDHNHEAIPTTCESHGDHWHCPSGVSEPTSPRASFASITSSSSPNTTSPAATSTLPDFQGAATHEGIAMHFLTISAVAVLVLAFVL